MRKTRVKVLVLTAFILFGVLFGATEVQAAPQKILGDGEIFKINNKTIRVDTKYSDLVSMFGAPKETTDSAFGGKAYSFLDDAYTWYLHVETKNDGTIAAAGGIGGNFVGKYWKNGDEDPYEYYAMQGTVISSYDSDYVIYAVYNYEITTSDLRTYWTNYTSDENNYLYGLQKHSILASKVFATKNGDAFPQTYVDEDMFYMSQQLKENGTSLVQYAQNTNKTSEIYRLSTGPKQWFEDLPNPIYLGNQTEFFEKGDAFKYFLYDLRVRTDLNSTSLLNMTTQVEPCFINPSFLKDRQQIELTASEKDKLAAAKAYYKAYSQKVDEFNSTNPTSLYEVEPQIANAPISPGKVHDIVTQSAGDYLNMIRAGAGLAPLALDDTYCEAAQYKATLVMYLNNHGYRASHYPPKVSEIPDEYYTKAQSCMSGENLYMGNVQASILHALNDGYGDPIDVGHRNNLINPYWSVWGVGQAGSGISFNIQSAHKFGGYSSLTEEAVGWPSNGITPLEAVTGVGLGNWSVILYKSYYTDFTCDKITIKCLNTNESYVIEKNNLKDKQKFEYCGGDQITFYDPNISCQANDVFEITLHNVQNTQTKELSDYSYRTIFYEFDETSTTNVTSINTNKDHFKLACGQSTRIIATPQPADTVEKLMQFSSSDPDTVSVRQDGLITAKAEGAAIITIKCGGIQKDIVVEVAGGLLGDVNHDGSVNSTDAALVLQFYQNGNATEEDLASGDIDGNGKLNSSDSTAILQIYQNGGK